MPLSKEMPCRGAQCGKAICFASKPGQTKGGIPVDPILIQITSITHPEHGRTLITEDGEVLRGVEVGDRGFRPHWASCPNAKDFRKGKKPNATHT